MKDIRIERFPEDEIHPNNKGHEVIYKLLREFGLGIRVGEDFEK